jgi:hypothetical protein
MAAQPHADLAAVFIHEGEQYFAVFAVVGLAIVDQIDESEGVVDRGSIDARRMSLSGAQCYV